MKRRNAPPIQWIPVFEAAARLLSFKKAAKELCITPPAVSQQIKVLEQYLGVLLFSRNGRKLRLTEAGDFYFTYAKQVVKSHKTGILEFDRRFNNRSLLVSTPLFIAQEILIPNFLSFQERFPQLDFRILTGSEIADFETETLDAAIRFGEGNWSNLQCRLLSKVATTPVCSPTYTAENDLAVLDWDDMDRLNRHTFITIDEELRDWKKLFPALSPKRKIVCDSYFSAIKSAEKGLGLTMGLIPSINNWINDQRLDMPLNKVFATNLGYWLVKPKDIEKDDLIDAFFGWAYSLFEQLPDLKSVAIRE